MISSFQARTFPQDPQKFPKPKYEAAPTTGTGMFHDLFVYPVSVRTWTGIYVQGTQNALGYDMFHDMFFVY
jgi:hypothetical protein